MYKKYTLALLLAATTHHHVSADFKEFAESAQQKAAELGSAALEKTAQFFKDAKNFTVEKVEKMMSHIDNINAVDENGNTLLMTILSSPHKKNEDNLAEISQLFIDRGIDLTIKNDDNDTALDIARNNNHEQAAHTIEQQLIQKGLNS